MSNLDTLGVLISFIALLASLLIVFDVLKKSYENRKSKKKTDKAIVEHKIISALKSDNIEEVGKYLENNLGIVTISQYTYNPKIRKRVTNLLNILTDYIGDTELVDEPVKITKPDSKKWRSRSELEQIKMTITQDNVWNGLAQLRRHIEVTLRELAIKNNLNVHKYGASKMLHTLIGLDIIPKNASKPLRIAISIANRGIHGYEVTEIGALNALAYADEGLEIIRGLPNN